MHLYFYIYMILYIYNFSFSVFVYRYVLLYTYGRRGMIQEQAGVCSCASIYSMYILYVYIDPPLLFASLQRMYLRPARSTCQWWMERSPSVLLVSCMRLFQWARVEAACETTGLSVNPSSSNPPRRDTRNAQGCVPAASSREVKEPRTQSGEGPSMLLVQDMAFPARWRQGIQEFCLLGGRWPPGTRSRGRTWWNPALCSSAICRGRWRGWRRAAWWRGGRWRRRGHCCWRPLVGICEWWCTGARAAGACEGEEWGVTGQSDEWKKAYNETVGWHAWNLSSEKGALLGSLWRGHSWPRQPHKEIRRALKLRIYFLTELRRAERICSTIELRPKMWLRGVSWIWFELIFCFLPSWD